VTVTAQIPRNSEEPVRDDAEAPPLAPTARSLRTRADIRAAAFQLAGDRPVADITVDQIARAARVSRRTFFNHFPSKNHAFIPEIEPFDPVVLERFRSRAVPDLLEAVEELVGSRAEMMGEVFSSSSPGWDIRRRNPELLPLVLGAFRDSELALRPVSADRLGVPEDDPAAFAAAALVTTVERTALDLWRHNGRAGSYLDEVHRTVRGLRAALRD
jgi:AcrR family transcriptional regulator